MHATIRIQPDDLSGDATRRLIAFHLAGMLETSPPESVHALDIDALRDPAVSFWSAWVQDDLAGIGALKTMDAERGELKSMRVDDRFRGCGIGRALLRHIVAIRVELTALEGKVKLSQNREERDRLGAADTLDARGDAAMARAMRDADPNS